MFVFEAACIHSIYFKELCKFVTLSLILRTFLIGHERKNSGQVWKGCQAFLADVLSQKEFMLQIFSGIALKFLTFGIIKSDKNVAGIKKYFIQKEHECKEWIRHRFKFI